ncbi:MAG: class IV adenylate cyclase [Gemmataceae bacterium]|nr:class IV adenylate cyclase [Gemmataceae bacterium]
MAGERRNLELKARCTDLDRARAASLQLGATPAGIENQTDTYFQAPIGRLKLREIEGQPAVLVSYDRPNREAARLSIYYLVPVPDAVTMKAALTAALGIRGEVRKRREILLWHNVRIHLDEVADLGRFIEFEAVLSRSEDETAAAGRLDELCRALAIVPAERLPTSYADMLGL